MFLFGGVKRILSLTLSTLMLLPTFAWAKDSAPPPLSSISFAYPLSFPPTYWNSTTEAPVFVEEVRVSGRLAYMVIAAIPREQEASVLSSLMSRQVTASYPGPESRVAIGVSGPSDPALPIVARAGKDVAVYALDTPVNQTPLARLDGVGEKTKRRVLARLQTISNYAGRNKSAILCSFFYGGVVGGYTAFVTSDVAAGLQVMVPLTAWNIFAATTSKWEKAIEFFAEGSMNVFELGFKLNGREMSPAAQRHAASFGKFMSTFLASAAGVGLVVGIIGREMSVPEFLFDSALFNYGVWDPTLFAKVQTGSIAQKWIPRYFSLQFVGGALAEASTYAGYHDAQYILSVNLATGLTFMFAGDRIEPFLASAHHKVRLTRAHVRASLRRGYRRAKAQVSCALDLGAPATAGATRAAYEDTW